MEDTSICTANYKKKESTATKKRRRERAGRRAARPQASNDRDGARRRELVIATNNVQTMAVGLKAQRGQRGRVPRSVPGDGLRHHRSAGN